MEIKRKKLLMLGLLLVAAGTVEAKVKAVKQTEHYKNIPFRMTIGQKYTVPTGYGRLYNS